MLVQEFHNRETRNAENAADFATVMMLWSPVREYYFCEKSPQKVVPPFAFILELHFHEVKIQKSNKK